MSPPTAADACFPFSPGELKPSPVSPPPPFGRPPPRRGRRLLGPPRHRRARRGQIWLVKEGSAARPVPHPRVGSAPGAGTQLGTMAHRPPPSARRPVPSAQCPPPNAQCPPPTAHRPPPTAQRPAPSIHRRPPSAHCPSPGQRTRSGVLRRQKERRSRFTF